MDQTKYNFVDKQEALAKLITPKGKVVTVVGTDDIRSTFEDGCLAQIVNVAEAPGIEEVVLNPDGHSGYGCPVGSVFASKDLIYPNAVGPDVKCSMSFLQLNVESDRLDDKATRRKIINALSERIPTGVGNAKPKKARPFNDLGLLKQVVIEGASDYVLSQLDIPTKWNEYCEDAFHGDVPQLSERLSYLMTKAPALEGKLQQLGGVGGGNHFMECNRVDIAPGMESVANTFGLKNGYIGFLNHFGSRGFGFMLTSGGKGWDGQFKKLEKHFNDWNIPFPGGDKHNVYAPANSDEGLEYLNDMYLGANFATVNHLLVCTYVLEAFREVLGNWVEADLVYYIAHNIIRREIVDSTPMWVHRKGATRALWAGHHELKGTRFYETGHPILLPGNPIDGSTIMVGQKGSRKALNSVNHGAGRIMSRKKASQTFNQKAVNDHFDQADILTNCRNYPLDEYSGAYKPYDPVIQSVEKAGLALTVAKLKPRMLIKDNDNSAENAA